MKPMISTLAFLFYLTMTAMAADVAIIDYADEWTQVEALGPTLDEMKIKYDDITDDVIKGNFQLAGYKLFFICSMATNNSTIHSNLDGNAKVIQDFVKEGGIVIEPTQADQNEANVDWLPKGLTCVRSDPDLTTVEIVKPDHPLFNTPNKLKEDDFLNWKYKGWPTVWESIASQSGFDVLAKSGDRFVILEAEYGEGKFVMMALAPDKYHVVGNDDYTKKQASLFFENLMHAYYLDFQALQPKGKVSLIWAELKLTCRR